MLELAAHGQQATASVGLDGAQRQADSIGDLFVGKATQKGKCDQFSPWRRQFGKCEVQVCVLLYVGDGVLQSPGLQTGIRRGHRAMRVFEGNGI